MFLKRSTGKPSICLEAPREELDCMLTKALPLAGRRVVVTRAKDQAASLVTLLEAQGAEAICFPTIVVRPPTDWGPLDRALDELSVYDWCIFTSARGVEAVEARLRERGEGPESLSGVNLAARGPKTARALEEFGLTVDCMPEEYRAEAIISAIGATNFAGSRLLLPRARVAREVLPETIRALGGTIDVVEAYQTGAPASTKTAELARWLQSGEISAVTFTSSSTVSNFLALMETYGGAGLLDGVVVACIGPITADTARSAGLEAEVVAKDYTVEGLVDAMIEYFGKTERSS